MQARPCLIVLAARPGNLPETKLQLAGLSCFYFRRFMAGGGQRKKIPVLFSLFLTRNKNISEIGVGKNFSAAECAGRVVVGNLDYRPIKAQLKFFFSLE